jgi:hypothetical protein
MATFHPTLPRGARVQTAQNGSLREIIAGPAHENDGTFNLMGGLRTSMATCGYRDIAEFNRGELMIAPAELLDRGVVGQELGVHAALAHSPGDQLGVLGAEVEDDHRAVRGGRRRAPREVDLGAALAHGDILPSTPVGGRAMVAPSG